MLCMSESKCSILINLILLILDIGANSRYKEIYVVKSENTVISIEASIIKVDWGMIWAN
jgi:hypothetical protein